MIKIGIHNSYASKDWDADYYSLINRVSDLGFDAMEAHPGTFMQMPKNKRKDLKKLAEDKGLEMTYCLGLPKEFDISSEDESVRKKGVQFCKDILGIVAEMEGKIFAGTNYAYWPYNYFTGTNDREKLRDISVKSMKEIIKVAEDNDIDYAFEVLNRFEQIIMNTAEEAVEYVKMIESPKAKINLDTFHMNIEEDTMDGAIFTAKDYLVDLHLGENNRKFPGTGRLPWGEIIGALKEINYDKYIILEPFVIYGGEIGKDVYLWRDLTNNASQDDMDAMAKASLDFLRDLINK